MSNRIRNILISLSLALLVLAVFWQVRSHEFVSFDDGVYVTTNPYIQDGLTWDGVAWAFTTTYANFWHPLTWLSHMLDWQLFGPNPAGHHLTNIILHAVNTIILFLVFLRMTGAPWKSAMVATLFAVHPLHVESVAWASERKDLLSTLFWLLTMAAYVLYVENRRALYYALVLVCFLLGLMAKPMLVTLPFVLLLLDYWPLERFQWHGNQGRGMAPFSGKDGPIVPLLEKVPFLLCAVLASILAFIAQDTGGATKSLDLFPWDVRVLNALISYTSYIVKTVWPTNLAVFYPHPGAHISLVHGLFSGLFLATVTAWALSRIKSSPYFVVGWLWFLGTLVPVIGLVQVGDHGMADRYTYVPLIGLFVVFAWSIPQALGNIPRRKTVFSVTASALITILAVCAWHQVSHWKNSATLFDKALAVGPPSPLVHTDLGLALAEQGELDRAMKQYEMALALNPDYIGARINLGSLLAGMERLDEAILHYRKAIQVKPDLAGAHYNLANALTRQGRLEEAISHYDSAIQHNPDDPDIHNNIGIALVRLNRNKEAIFHFRKALQIKPDFKSAQQNLHLTLGAN